MLNLSRIGHMDDSFPGKRSYSLLYQFDIIFYLCIIYVIFFYLWIGETWNVVIDVKTRGNSLNTANIFLSIYDIDGRHEDTVIYSKFRTEASPEVVLKRNISRPSKLRVRNDEAGDSPFYYLEKVCKRYYYILYKKI